MTVREKAIKGLIIHYLEPTLCSLCPYVKDDYCAGKMAKDIIDLLEKQEPISPNHIHEEYAEHMWEKDSDGTIDTFAFEAGFHNGPVCERCGYHYCIHCDPDGETKKPCVLDEYRCPSCDIVLHKRSNFCVNCGQAIKWEESEETTKGEKESEHD